jgi:hypothetical protein
MCELSYANATREMKPLGLSIKSEELDFGHMAARAFVIYLALIVLVRANSRHGTGAASRG